MRIIKKFFPIIFVWAVFIFITFRLDYPTSIGKASITTLTIFLTPLFLALLLTINLYLKSLFASSVISLGIILLLILKALESLNWLTFIITILAVIFLMGSFKKPSGLTSKSNTPRLKALLRRKK